MGAAAPNPRLPFIPAASYGGFWFFPINCGAKNAIIIKEGLKSEEPRSKLRGSPAFSHKSKKKAWEILDTAGPTRINLSQGKSIELGVIKHEPASGQIKPGITGS